MAADAQVEGGSTSGDEDGIRRTHAGEAVISQALDLLKYLAVAIQMKMGRMS